MITEIRDHRGRLHEARDDAGRLVYASRSNYGRLVDVWHGRATRTRWHGAAGGGIVPHPGVLLVHEERGGDMGRRS